MIKDEYKYSELTGKILGCSMEVHKELGYGFPEIVYQRALEIELKKQNIKFKKENDVTIYYKDIIVGKRRVDFLVEEIIPVEIKVISILEEKKINQILNYLYAFKLEIGLIINFGGASLQFKRLMNSNYNK
jgi:GxxExxY protein